MPECHLAEHGLEQNQVVRHRFVTFDIGSLMGRHAALGKYFNAAFVALKCLIDDTGVGDGGVMQSWFGLVVGGELLVL
jgi:hypothetical protein